MRLYQEVRELSQIADERSLNQNPNSSIPILSLSILVESPSSEDGFSGARQADRQRLAEDEQCDDHRFPI
ncbi:hypothetical protein YC2023_082824 [Brassica napus]